MVGRIASAVHRPSVYLKVAGELPNVSLCRVRTHLWEVAKDGDDPACRATARHLQQKAADGYRYDSLLMLHACDGPRCACAVWLAGSTMTFCHACTYDFPLALCAVALPWFALLRTEHELKYCAGCGYSLHVFLAG